MFLAQLLAMGVLAPNGSTTTFVVRFILITTVTIMSMITHVKIQNRPGVKHTIERRIIMTNGDKLRSMSDEQLALHFAHYICQHVSSCPGKNCEECRMIWLKQEAKDA